MKKNISYLIALRESSKLGVSKTKRVIKSSCKRIGVVGTRHIVEYVLESNVLTKEQEKNIKDAWKECC